MTMALLCDGCGRMASDSDPTDDDPTRRWWALEAGPTPGGMPVGIRMTAIAIIPEGEPVPEMEEHDLEPAEPCRHFCRLGCLLDWLQGRMAEDAER
jgi:hypothetical protein